MPGVGNINAVNRSLNEIQTEIQNRLIKKGIMPNFQLEIKEFKSQKVYFLVSGEISASKIIPLTNSKIHLKELILDNDAYLNSKNKLSVLILTRDGKEFRMSMEQVFNQNSPKIWLQNNDQIEVIELTYKPGQIFALNGTNNANSIFIDPSKRESLADILFVSNGAFSNISSKRSEIYLLRGRNPSMAYHLDAQNVSRVLVAAKTELRPNDIIFVAERPIISFSRTLAEISPLRILLGDIQDNNLP